MRRSAFRLMGRWLGVCVPAALVGGCINVQSRVPLYDPKRDCVVDSKLLGTWEGHGPNYVRVTIEPARAVPEGTAERASGVVAPPPPGTTPTMYRVTMMGNWDDDPGTEEVAFAADLVHLGSRRYLFAAAGETPHVSVARSATAGAMDSSAAPPPPEAARPKEPSYPIPMLRVKRRSDTLYLRWLDTARLAVLLHENPWLLPHTWTEPATSPAAAQNSFRIDIALYATQGQAHSFLRDHEAELYPISLKFRRAGDARPEEHQRR